VKEIDRAICGSRAKVALTMLLLPAPDGAATMYSVPRATASDGFDGALMHGSQLVDFAKFFLDVPGPARRIAAGRRGLRGTSWNQARQTLPRGAGTQLYQSMPFPGPSGRRRALCHMGIRGPVL